MIFWEKQKIVISFYEACTRPIREKYGLTQMEYDILMFLHNNPEYDTAADIVRIRKLTKSHVSASIKKLVGKKLLLAHYFENNNKSIHLQISDLATDMVCEGEEAQNAFGIQLFHGFTEEEFQMIRDLFERMCDNSLEGINRFQNGTVQPERNRPAKCDGIHSTDGIRSD